jgi:hypothetical protein
MNAKAAETLSLPNINTFVGEELGVSDWETLDQQRIDNREWRGHECALKVNASLLGLAHGAMVVADAERRLFVEREAHSEVEAQHAARLDRAQ